MKKLLLTASYCLLSSAVVMVKTEKTASKVEKTKKVHVETTRDRMWQELFALLEQHNHPDLSNVKHALAQLIFDAAENGIAELSKKEVKRAHKKHCAGMGITRDMSEFNDVFAKLQTIYSKLYSLVMADPSKVGYETMVATLDSMCSSAAAASGVSGLVGLLNALVHGLHAMEATSAVHHEEPAPAVEPAPVVEPAPAVEPTEESAA